MTTYNALISNACPVCEAPEFVDCNVPTPHLARRRLAPWPQLSQEIVATILTYAKEVTNGLDEETKKDPVNVVARAMSKAAAGHLSDPFESPDTFRMLDRVALLNNLTTSGALAPGKL